MNAHDILEVSPGATEKEIKAAYKKLAKQYHPDLNNGDKAAEDKFKEINAAYQKLTNPEPEPSPGPSYTGPFFDEAIFNSIFRGGAGPGMSQVLNRVAIDPELLIKGGTFDWKTSQFENINGHIRPVVKNHKVTIEADTPALARIGLPSNGNHFVFLELVPVSTDKYEVTDLINLTENHTVNAFTAMCGGEIEVTAPNQKRIKLKIPAGTQPNSIHRIRGLGLRSDGHRGDYNVKVVIHIPTIMGDDEEDIQHKILASYTDRNT